MNVYAQQRIEQRATVGDLISGLLDKIATENREATAEESAQLATWEQRAAALDIELAQLETRQRANAGFMATVGRLGALDEQREERQAQRREAPPARVETRSAGAQFVGSDAFKAYRGRGSMEAMDFAGFLETRAAITTEDLEGAIPAHIWGGPTEAALRTPLLDVIGREVVSSGQVEYITWSDASLAGGPIPEGDVKPEATLTATPHALPLETYAHWKAITRQTLEDYARIQSIVDGKLRVGLAKKLESVAAGVLLAAAFESVSNDSPLAGVRHAVGLVQANGFQPNAVLLNPADYADFDITAAEASNSGPTQFGTFWGLTPVPVPSVPVGTQVVGDFQEAITWFDRNTASVYMTDSHADFFIRNMLIILAEQRSAFAATNLEAAVKVTSGTPPQGLSAAAKKAAAE